MPAYHLDLQHSLNRATILSAKPGKPIAVLVRPEGDASAPPIGATGTLSEDGRSFDVAETGESWAWSDLKELITRIDDEV